MVHTPSHSEDMTSEPGKFELSAQELRAALAMPQRAPRRYCRSSRNVTLATDGLV